MHIKILEPNKEFNEIKTLFKDTFSSDPWNEDWSDEIQLNNYMLDLLNANNSLNLGLYNDNNELVGATLGRKLHYCSGNRFRIDEFFISRKYQRSGLGSIFFDLINKEKENLGISTILLETIKNYGAHNFYLKNDFKILTEWELFYKEI